MRIAVGLWIVIALACSAAYGEDVKPAKPDPAALARQISAQMASGDQAARAEAAASMHKLVALAPVFAAGQFRGSWLPLLTEARMYQDIDELAVECMTSLPLDAGSFEMLQQTRVRAFLQAKKPDRALAAARGLFNVASMATTNNALLLLAECLNAAHAGDLRIAERFKAQQVAGAALATTAADTQNASADSILLAIKTEGEAEPFERAAKKIFAEDYPSLCVKGNLFLLANQPAEARLVFERAYAVALDPMLPQASENLARCMKAQDGSIGRANAWIISLRPRVDTRPGR